MIVAVDLAAKYSAVVHMSEYGAVREQFDSVELDESMFLDRVIYSYTYGFAEQLVVEDLPHGVDYRGLVKRVCQIQGRIAERMYGMNRIDNLLYVDPATWRRGHEKLRARGSGMEAVIPVAADLGYTPPELQHLAGPRGGKALVTKVQTDYCAAFLIADWARRVWNANGHFDVPGTCRYGRPTIKKER